MENKKATNTELQQFLDRRDNADAYASLVAKLPFSDLLIELSACEDNHRSGLLFSVAEAYVKFHAEPSQAIASFCWEDASNFAEDVRYQKLHASLIIKAVNKPVNEKPQPISAELWRLLLRSICSTDIAVGELAADAILQSIAWDRRCQSTSAFYANLVFDLKAAHAFGQPFLSAAKDPAASTLAIRVGALFVRMMKEFPYLTGRVLASGIPEKVVDMCKSDDILVKLNCMELTKELGSFREGRSLLAEQGYVQSMISDLDHPLADETAQTAALFLVANLLKVDSPGFSVSDEHRDILIRKLEEYLFSNDTTKLLCGCELWSALAPFDQASSSKIQLSDRVANLVLHPADAEIASAAMHAWTVVLSRQIVSKASLGDLEEIVRKAVVPNAAKVLRARPFAEVRPAVYALLAMAPSAMEVFASDAANLKVLLDFQSESSSEARIAKHKFVMTLVKEARQSDAVQGLIGADHLKMLQKFADGGPFYVPHGVAPSLADTAA